MKATGIVRRVDDLGRVVIPKEIRRVLRIKEGDPLEIFTDREGGVIFRKYSPMADITDFAEQLCGAIKNTTGYEAVATDQDTVIAAPSPKTRELKDKPISSELHRIMLQRKGYRVRNTDSMIGVAEDSDRHHVGVVAPIVVQGDPMGCVVILLDGRKIFADADQKLAETVASFLSKQMDF